MYDKKNFKNFITNPQVLLYWLEQEQHHASAASQLVAGSDANRNIATHDKELAAIFAQVGIAFQAISDGYARALVHVKSRLERERTADAYAVSYGVKK